MQHSHPQLFAVIPAAGRSRRMGRPKLLLPLGETTVIGLLLQTLDAACIETFVLIRPGDHDLCTEVATWPATMVQPDEDPPHMRTSVELLLQSIERLNHPEPDAGWLLIPADHPLLRMDTLNRLVDSWRRDPSRIVLPVHESRRGHPTIFPWKLAAAVAQLPPEVGVNQLLRDHPDTVVEVPVDDPTVTLDLDTPAEYERASRLYSSY